MKKAVIGTEGYLKPCLICGGYIENEMYETVGPVKHMKYFHKKCFTAERKQNNKQLMEV